MVIYQIGVSSFMPQISQTDSFKGYNSFDILIDQDRSIFDCAFKSTSTNSAYILGIDLSLRRTGITLLDTVERTSCSFPIVTRTKVISGYSRYGKVRTRLEDIRGIPRIKIILQTITDILNTISPAIVAIEGYAFASKGRSVFDTGEIGGLIRFLIQDYIDKSDAQFIEVSPTAVHKACSDKGNLKKDLVYRFCNARFGTNFDKKQEDEADSFIVAMLPWMLQDAAVLNSFVTIEGTLDSILALELTKDVMQCRMKNQLNSKSEVQPE